MKRSATLDRRNLGSPATSRSDHGLTTVSLTRITRTTTVSVRNRFAAVLYPALWVGLKSVHRFVFRNWQRPLPPKQDRPPRSAHAMIANGSLAQLAEHSAE